MYLTIWIALALFAAGEVGRARLGFTRGARSWAWWCWIAGILFCAVHFALALEVRYGWSHAEAVRATAAQTAAVYGLDWGGGFWLNYAFLTAWIADAVGWRRGADWPAAVVWTLRAFYFVVILNAAVIFAAGWRPMLGLLIVGALVIAWGTTDRGAVRPTRTATAETPGRRRPSGR
jgi:hypothetical protein